MDLWIPSSGKKVIMDASAPLDWKDMTYLLGQIPETIQKQAFFCGLPSLARKRDVELSFVCNEK